MLKNTLSSSKNYKVFVFGAKSTGKTHIIEQLIFGNSRNYNCPKEYKETIDDVYIAYVDNDKGGKEKISFYDTSGLINSDQIFNSDIIKNYITYADGIVLIYSLTDYSSFVILDQLKKAIDRFKEKKELPIICLANKMNNLKDVKIELEKAYSWAQKERIKFFEVSATDRKTLIEPFTYISSKLNPPQNKSTFTQLSRKVKGANIAMEL